jgi:hypothetical protein
VSRGVRRNALVKASERHSNGRPGVLGVNDRGGLASFFRFGRGKRAGIGIDASSSVLARASGISVYFRYTFPTRSRECLDPLVKTNDE